MQNNQTALPSLTEADYARSILGPGVVLVEFFAHWCTPCEAMRATLVELASEMAGAARFYRVDADACGALSQQLGIVTLPTTLIYRDGRLIERTTGPKARHVLKALIENANAQA